MSSETYVVNPAMKELPSPDQGIIFYSIRRTTNNPEHIIQQLIRASIIEPDADVESIDHDGIYDLISTAIRDKSKDEIVDFCIQLAEIDEKSKGRKVIDFYIANTDLPHLLMSYLEEDLEREVETGRNCAAIAGLCGEDGPIQESFLKAGAICTHLTDVLTKNCGSSVVLVDICEAIRKIARNGKCQEAFSGTNCPVLVIDCFKSHFKDPYIVKHLCRVIINTGFSNKTRDIYFDLESYKFMTNALRQYNHIPEIISEICWAISNIAALDKFKILFGKQGCCRLLADLGDLHHAHMDCLKEILSAICNLSVNDDNEGSFGKLGLCRQLCNWTKQYLEKYRQLQHEGDPKAKKKDFHEVFRKLADALNNLSFLEENKSRLLEAGAVVILANLVKEMKDDYELVGATASVIGSLAVQTEAQELFHDERIVEDLIATTALIHKLCDEKESKNRENLATDHLRAKEALLLKNHTEVRRYPAYSLQQDSEKEKDMQFSLVMIFCALKNLVALNENANLFATFNGTFELIWAVQTFLDNKELMKEALWTIANLSFNESSRISFLQNDYSSFQSYHHVVQSPHLCMIKEMDDSTMRNINFFFHAVLKLGYTYLGDQSIIKEVSVTIYSYMMNTLPLFFQNILAPTFTGTYSFHRYLVEIHRIHEFYLLMLAQNANDPVAITACCWLLRQLIREQLNIDFFHKANDGSALFERLLCYHQDEEQVINLLDSIKVPFHRNAVDVVLPFALE
jgi:hypothetical protein